jgi:hypothetical protein
MKDSFNVLDTWDVALVPLQRGKSQNSLDPESLKANEREPKTCLGWVFIYKLGCLNDVHVLISTWMHAHICSWKLGPISVLLSKVCPWLSFLTLWPKREGRVGISGASVPCYSQGCQLIKYPSGWIYNNFFVLVQLTSVRKHSVSNHATSAHAEFSRICPAGRRSPGARTAGFLFFYVIKRSTQNKLEYLS